jgi:hypothetical protein
MSTLLEFPTPIRFGGRLFFDRHEVENHKRKLMRLAPIEATRRFRSSSSLRSKFQTNSKSTGARWVGGSAVASAVKRHEPSRQTGCLTDKGEVWLHNEHEWSWDKLPPLPTDDNAAVEHDAE